MDYAWGKVGDKSIVYKFLQKSGCKDLCKKTPYAELWIGDHDKAPSLLPGGLRLKEDSRYGPIKYLFKVLSVEKPLSIQVHPNKELAEVLHEKNPENYPDGNAKPEMALFISKTSLLYGFRPYEEIAEFIKSVSELHKIVTPQVADAFYQNPSSDLLKKVVEKALLCPNHELKEYAASISRKIDSSALDVDKNTRSALRTISSHFPGDVGIFFPFFLNVVCGEPGTAIYIPTGVLHSYLNGDLYETMTVSDNVIRAGMTPKFIDIPSICHAVDFKPQGPIFIKPSNDCSISSFVPPVHEFCIKRVTAKEDETISFHVDSVATVLVENGCGKVNFTNVRAGSAVVVQPGITKISASDNSQIKCILCHSMKN